VAGFNIHRGCLAIGERPPPAWDAWYVEADLQVRAGAASSRLERWATPTTSGATFRAAAAFGAGGVLLDAACADPLYRKAIRTSMGRRCRCRLPAACRGSTPSQGSGRRLDGGRPDAGRRGPARDVFAGTRRARVLVLGHEGDGISDATAAACTQLARIPMTRRRRFAERGDGGGHRAVIEVAAVAGAVMSEIWWDVVGVGENSVDHVLRLPALPSAREPRRSRSARPRTNRAARW
jgi:hypothetical protein